MKIRNGFVSNSSSSSFCIVGVSMNDSELEKLINYTPQEDDDGVVEYLYDILSKNKIKNLSVYHDHEGGYVYFGRDVTSMKDDETLREFKEKTLVELRKAIPRLKGKLNFIQETIYN